MEGNPGNPRVFLLGGVSNDIEQKKPEPEVNEHSKNKVPADSRHRRPGSGRVLRGRRVASGYSGGMVARFPRLAHRI